MLAHTAVKKGVVAGPGAGGRGRAHTQLKSGLGV